MPALLLLRPVESTFPHFVRWGLGFPLVVDVVDGDFTTSDAITSSLAVRFRVSASKLESQGVFRNHDADLVMIEFRRLLFTVRFQARKTFSLLGPKLVQQHRLCSRCCKLY